MAKNKLFIFLIFSLIINYFVYLLSKKTNKIIIFGIIYNVFSLFIFKYLDFIVTNINTLFSINIPIIDIVPPLAISFYTFSQISFLVDVYRGKITDCAFIDYSCYIMYFPKLIQGPITNYSDYLEELNKKKIIDWSNIYYGLRRFAFGLVKKAIFADTLSNFVNEGYSDIGSLSSIETVLVVFCYFLQIYFDFSGYSDMAIGTSNMFGINIKENFKCPYKSTSLTEFWKRWHISLNTFLTQYIYIPLGGNRKGHIKTCVNILIIFLISGLWHGPKWTFVLWGLVNGIMVVLEKCLYKRGINISKIISIPFTFLFTNLSWVLFRSNNLLQAKQIYSKLLTFDSLSINNSLLETAALPELKFIFRFVGLEDNFMVYFLIVVFASVLMIAFEDKIDFKKSNRINILLLIIVLVWCTLSFSNVVTYIYEGF